MSDMPESIKDIFNELKNQVTWVHTKWENYRQVFGTSEKRLRLLDECAHAFFLIIHNALIDDVLMSLSKLTDPAGKKTKKHLSFEKLQKRVKKNCDHELASELQARLDDLKKKSGVIRTHRDKRLAHLDSEVAMKQGLNLNKISVKMVEEALALAGEYMNAIEGHYYPTEFLYEGGISSPRGDGNDLVAILKDGLRFKELLKAGKIPLEELCQGEWSDA